MKDSRWTIGDEVMVINGSERGSCGVIKGPTKHSFDGETCWAVLLAGTGYVRTIRESFLAPVPARSDEDVLGPLRSVTCPE